MKMKYKLYIVIFMVMCILPFAGMAVAKTETTTENTTEETPVATEQQAIAE